ncbi:MAG TPA: M1 family aminopeptidase, partial [Actinomycetota bacterium]|nr:M1 family aminopeptidase [Actinomycetota bacterium]
GRRGWATDPPTTTLAEASTSPTANFEVSIEAPQHLDVVATGEEVGPGRWAAENVRDFAVALGRFDFARSRVNAGRPVQVTVGVAEGLDADPEEFTEAIRRALRDLSRRYGAYPWPTFSMAIMPDLGRAGIEYPAMVFQGEDSLEWATTHEVAHSWFYGLVGNNQGRDPWLDEGVTSWAQARGDGMLGYFRDYEMSQVARGRLGRGMAFWDEHENHYYDGVYVQGVKALDALGEARRVDCALKRYVAQNAYGVATPEDLVEALEPSFPRAGRVLERFGARF